MAVLCVGGARIVGLDANMALCGAIPGMKERGVDMHLCAAHAEYAPVEQTRKRGSMGMWVVGPIPDPGQSMKIDDHALAALFHPRQVGKEPGDLPNCIACHSYKYAVLD